MNYQDSVRYLLSLGRELATPQHARVQKFDLRNITLLAGRMGNPHRAVPCVHIAGTNGKGSTAAMLESILRSAGLKTGLYTSPHLEKINERIRINGDEISDAGFAEAFTRVQAFVEVMLASGTLTAHPTFFECITAMAFDVFAREKCDFAVYEVGMGGRLDSTNIVTPEVAVITAIDFDHEQYLGHSIEEIAAEKAGIIKPGVPVVCAAGRPEARTVIARRATELNARLVNLDNEESSGIAGLRPTSCTSQASGTLAIPLPGRFQTRNAATAIAAAKILAERGFSISEDAIRHGVETVRWPGRLEKIQDRPTIYLDGTHNPAGARELLSFWNEELAGRKIHLVYGALRDKPVDEIAGILFPRAANVILTAPQQPRALSANVLAEIAGHYASRFEVVADSKAAVERAFSLAAPEDVVFITGSLYLVGELRRVLVSRTDSVKIPAASRTS